MKFVPPTTSKIEDLQKIVREFVELHIPTDTHTANEDWKNRKEQMRLLFLGAAWATGVPGSEESVAVFRKTMENVLASVRQQDEEYRKPTELGDKPKTLGELLEVADVMHYCYRRYEPVDARDPEAYATLRAMQSMADMLHWILGLPDTQFERRLKTLKESKAQAEIAEADGTTVGLVLQ